MQSQFLAAINQLCEEKGIPKEEVLETIKAALRTAYRKDYGNREQNIEVILDDKQDRATILLVKDVVKTIDNEHVQITLKEAKKYKADCKVGEQIKIDVTPLEYGRIAAQSAKQVIIQRIQEAERQVMYDSFKDRENELLNAVVHRVENNQVYINLEDKTTTLLPAEDQIPNERYYPGQRLKLYLEKVIKTTKGPQLLISRTHPNLVRKLMELEIPEIKAGSVEIKAVAREPGVRCKVAVRSNDPKIDPIGSCVGQKGVRVQSVMDEVHGERIDIIEYNDDPDKFIKASLAPAKVDYLKIDDKRRRVGVYVRPEQRPLAIGRNGQNVQLASKLTGFEIDIMDLQDLDQKILDEQKMSPAPEKKAEITEVKGLGLSPEVIAALEKSNLSQVGQLKGLTVQDMMGIEGITEESAKQIVEAVKKV